MLLTENGCGMDWEEEEEETDDEEEEEVGGGPILVTGLCKSRELSMRTEGGGGA